MEDTSTSNVYTTDKDLDNKLNESSSLVSSKNGVKMLLKLNSKNQPGLKFNGPLGRRRKRSKPKRYVDQLIKEDIFETPIKKKPKLTKSTAKPVLDNYPKIMIPAHYENYVTFFRPFPLKSQLIITHADSRRQRRNLTNFFESLVLSCTNTLSGINFLFLNLLKRRSMSSLSKRIQVYKNLQTVRRESIRFGAIKGMFRIGIILPDIFEQHIKGSKLEVFDKSKKQYLSWKTYFTSSKKISNCTIQIDTKLQTEDIWLKILEQIQDNSMHPSIQTIFETQHCPCQLNRTQQFRKDYYYETNRIKDSTIEECNRHSLRKTIFMTFDDEVTGSITFCVKLLRFKTQKIIFVEILAVVISNLGVLFSQSETYVSYIVQVLIETLIVFCYDLKHKSVFPLVIVLAKHCMSSRKNIHNLLLGSLRTFNFIKQGPFLEQLKELNCNRMKFYLLWLASKFSHEYCHGFFVHDSESRYFFIDDTSPMNSLKSNRISVSFKAILDICNSKAAKVLTALLVEKIRKVTPKPTQLFPILAKKKFHVILPVAKKAPISFVNMSRKSRSKFFNIEIKHQTFDLTQEDDTDIKQKSSKYTSVNLFEDKKILTPIKSESESKPKLKPEYTNLLKQKQKSSDVNNTKPFTSLLPSSNIKVEYITSDTWKTTFVAFKKKQAQAGGFLRIKKYKAVQKQPNVLFKAKVKRELTEKKKVPNSSQKLLTVEDYFKRSNRLQKRNVNIFNKDDKLVDLT